MATANQMARNGSGTYSVPTSFTSGSTISSSTMNANLADIGAEITNSLPRDGQAAMTAAFKAFAGTLAAPGIAFGTDTGTGIRRSAGGTMRHVSSGADILEVSSTGISMVSGTITDANSVVVVGMPTGAVLPYFATTAPTGWVRLNARTIGNASSAATERANADTSALFTFLYNNFSDSVCAVSGGRGADAATDYAANKTIALPDLRGRGLFGLDDMGNSAASRLGTVITSSTTNGGTGGAETITIAQNRLPNVTPTISISDPGHTHAATVGSGSVGNVPAGGSTVVVTGNVGITAATTGITASSSSINGGVSQQPLSIMPPAFLTTFIIKL